MNEDVPEAAVPAAVAATLLMAAADVFDDVEDGDLTPDDDPAAMVNVAAGLLLLFQRACDDPRLRAACARRAGCSESCLAVMWRPASGSEPSI